jgi:HKD family nuclease
MSVEYLGGPTSDSAGEVFTRELRNGGWTRLTIVVAFAKLSGVRYVEGPLSGFVSGGGRVDITLGVDMLGSTYEAAWYLMNAVAPRGRLLLASAEPGATFHPKIFIFSDAAATDPSPTRALRGASRVLILVGSSNLTRGGLHTNDEASILWRPRLSQPDEASAWASLTDALSSWLDAKDPSIVGRATASRLATLAREGRLPTELVLAGARSTAAGRVAARRSGSGRPRRRVPTPPPLTGSPPPATGPGAAARRSSPGFSVLIARLSFGRRRRWPQWELNSDILRGFFGISTPGTPVPREGVNRSGVRLAAMSNPLVIGIGGNRRLEFPEPDGRPDPSPRRVLLVVVDRRPSPFRYAVLLPGDAEYEAVDALNQSSAPIGQHVEGTRRVIVPYAALATVWPGCPL